MKYLDSNIFRSYNNHHDLQSSESAAWGLLYKTSFHNPSEIAVKWYNNIYAPPPDIDYVESEDEID